MYGAILGDIIGQPYEFGPNNIKTKDFSLFTKKPRFTDDSVMTVAICDGILTAGFDADEKTMKKSIRNAFGLLLLITFVLTEVVSNQKIKITTLAQEIAILKHKEGNRNE